VLATDIDETCHSHTYNAMYGILWYTVSPLNKKMEYSTIVIFDMRIRFRKSFDVAQALITNAQRNSNTPKKRDKNYM